MRTGSSNCCRALRPDVLFCNEDEASTLGTAILPASIGSRITVVKRGAAPAIVHEPGGRATEVPAVTIAGELDTTGAGDAFAAGFLVALERGAPPRCHRGGTSQRGARDSAGVGPSPCRGGSTAVTPP